MGMETLARGISYQYRYLCSLLTAAGMDRETYIRKEINCYQQDRCSGCIEIYVPILPHITWQRYNFYILLQNIDN